jgi:uncharacterized membrane protein (UPF0182 family)
MVLGKDGKLYYMLDAYTVTDKYPYSQSFDKSSFNYMRNSVKIVLNAYSGEVNFYIFDNKDPIIKVYSKIYPTLFKSADQLPAELKEHIRYPEDLFTIQSYILNDYHMENPTVFYNREDRWELSKVLNGKVSQIQEPYYSVIRLPGEDKEDYVIMRVFSPVGKQNMVAWLAGRSDGENYGKLLLYKFPKGMQIPGTAQVESQIDQDPVISGQLSLWGQGGSKVLRGNLLVYPIGGSLLYVEPLYIEAEQTKYPQLKKVFVYYKDKVVMEDTLEEALTKLFGVETAGKDTAASQNITSSAVTAGTAGNTGTIENTGTNSNNSGINNGAVTNNGSIDNNVKPLIKRLIELNSLAKEKLSAGDWAGYGEVQKEMDTIINNLEQQSK